MMLYKFVWVEWKVGGYATDLIHEDIVIHEDQQKAEELLRLKHGELPFRRNSWLAVTQYPLEPGLIFHCIGMELPDRRFVVQGSS